MAQPPALRVVAIQFTKSPGLNSLNQAPTLTPSLARVQERESDTAIFVIRGCAFAHVDSAKASHRRYHCLAMSALNPFQFQQTESGEIPPQAVIPLRPKRIWLPLTVLLPAVAGIVLTIFRIMNPEVLITREGDATTYVVSGAQIGMSASIVALCAVIGIASLFLRPSPRVAMLSATVLVLCIGLGLTLLHHRNAKVVITSDSLTAPLRARGILPTDSLTLRFDKMQMLQFIGHPDRWERTYQRIYTGFGASGEVEISVGPLFRAVHEELVGRATAYGVRVVH